MSKLFAGDEKSGNEYKVLFKILQKLKKDSKELIKAYQVNKEENLSPKFKKLLDLLLE